MDAMMTPELRQALTEAIEVERSHGDLADRGWWDAIEAYVEATPDGVIDLSDYDDEDNEHVWTTIAYFGLEHLAL